MDDLLISLLQAYVIRVRRKGRLDEYVVRSEDQFIKYYKSVGHLLLTHFLDPCANSAHAQFFSSTKRFLMLISEIFPENQVNAKMN